MLAIHSNNFSTLLLLLALSAAVVIDLRSHRIPNWLSGLTLCTGLALQALLLGSAGLVSGLWGVAMAFVLLIPFYLLKGMGAGDVKLMMGIGSFLGPWDVAMAVGFTLLCGTVAGISILLWRKGLKDWASRYWLMLRAAFRTWRPMYIPPAQNEASSHKFPYAAAIAGGTTIALWWLLQLEPIFFSIRSVLEP